MSELDKKAVKAAFDTYRNFGWQTPQGMEKSIRVYLASLNGKKNASEKAQVDTKLEAAMKRLTYALGNREAADAVKELIEVMQEARSCTRK